MSTATGPGIDLVDKRVGRLCWQVKSLGGMYSPLGSRLFFAAVSGENPRTLQGSRLSPIGAIQRLFYSPSPTCFIESLVQAHPQPETLYYTYCQYLRRGRLVRDHIDESHSARSSSEEVRIRRNHSLRLHSRMCSGGRLSSHHR